MNPLSPSGAEISTALGHLKALTEFAYEKGFHELGYDPVAVIERALKITVDPNTPMGRVQRNILKIMAQRGSWDPKNHDRHSMRIALIHAANGLVARNFALLVGGVYVITYNGDQEAIKRGWMEAKKVAA